MQQGIQRRRNVQRALAVIATVMLCGAVVLSSELQVPVSQNETQHVKTAKHDSGAPNPLEDHSTKGDSEHKPDSQADWPQWRGPNRNGVAETSPALIDSFPAEGPLKLWTSSDEIPCGEDGGWGCVSIAAGKAYVYTNQKVPSGTFIIRKISLSGSGYSEDMPADLSKSVEDARVSDGRKAVMPESVDGWVSDWVKANIKEDQLNWTPAAKARLRAGPEAIPLDALRKLAENIGKKFNDQASAAEWLKSLGFDGETQKKILSIMPESVMSVDFVFCLDCETGKTVWKKQIGGKKLRWPDSSTPTLAGGKVYQLNSEASVHCLDALSGDLLWKSETFGLKSDHNRSSSILLIDNVAIFTTDCCAAGISTTDGKTLWKDTTLTGEEVSSARWTNNGKTWAIVKSQTQAGMPHTEHNGLHCLNPGDGKEQWNVTCQGASTPTVVGDYAIIASGGANKVEKNGLLTFKLGASEAKTLWSVPNTDDRSGPIIHDGKVYIVGGTRGSACCLDLESGKVCWTEPLGHAQYSSPVLADGKIIAVNGDELVVFKATPAKFELIGRAKLDLEKWSSPAIAGGRLFLRTSKNVVCYDLRKR
jgi:outer membrane protein assembly factor BamB